MTRTTAVTDNLPYDWMRDLAPVSIVARFAPKPIIEKLAAAIGKAMREDAVIQRLAAVGTEAVGSSPSELDGLTHQQFDLYRGIVRNNKSLLSSQ